jgi:ferredoxin--NADP+ reductase
MPAARFLVATRRGKEALLEMGENVLNALVTQRVEVAPGLVIMRVVPDGWELPPFRAGQFAVLGLPPEAPRCPGANGDEAPSKPGTLIRRSYSIASSSVQRRYLEFYFNLVTSGTLTPRLFALKEGDRVWLGPKIAGLFTFDQLSPDANIVMIATGTGLAPYMSMLRTDVERSSGRRLAVLHGARHARDLGYRAELVMMDRRYPCFAYLATISRPEEEPEPWTGLVGHVQDLWQGGALESIWGIRPQPPDTHVFLCGNPTMIEDLTHILAAEGFREHTRQNPGEIHIERYW